MTGATSSARISRSSLLLVTHTLDEVARVQLPRLHALCAELRREVLVADAEPLTDAIQEHLAAARLLAFELLVPWGLRASASRADEAAFRSQVERLVEATADTWTELRTYLGASAGAAARADVLLSEFLMQARGVQRRAATCDPPLQGALEEGAAGSTDSRLQSLRRQCVLLAAACATASSVRRLMHESEQERAAVHAALQKVAHTLGGGLLERLRPMVAAIGSAGRDDVDAARTARDGLNEVLAGAAERMRRLHGVRSQLVTALDAMAASIELSMADASGGDSMLA